MSANVYAFQNGSTVMIDHDSVNFTGTWSSTGTYVASNHDAVVYGGANYIAIVNNVGGIPTYVPRRGQAKWSPLVLIRTGTNTGGHTAEEAYLLAEEALDTATTALAAANTAETTANEALGLVENVETVAGLALTTAWTGTAAASAAQEDADSARAEARQAYDIAVAGTNNNAGDLAYRALQTAWSGTSGANSAFSIAVAGTVSAAAAASAASSANATAAAALQTAWNGTQVGNNALQTAWRGTQDASTLFSWFGTMPTDANLAQVEQRGSQFSVILRDQGTNYTNEQTEITEQQSAGYAFDLWVAGTNYTNSQVVASQGSTSLTVFWAGTDYTNLRVGEEAAARISGDNQVLAISVQGTNQAQVAAALAAQALAAAWAGTTASVPLAGGTMTGNLRVPQIFLNSGSIPASQAVNGTVYYDFLGPAFQETTADRNLQIGAKNYTPGAEISVVLISNGQQKTISYDAEFSWFGTQVPVTSTTANKKILVALASTGTTPSSVLGASTPQL